MPRRSLLLLVPALLLAISPAVADDLEGLLSQVGSVYAESYTEPLIHAFGANQNTGLYHTAQIPSSRFTFSIGIKFMATYLHEDDGSFQKVIHDVQMSDYLDPSHPNYNDNGDIVLAGPTVFGSPDDMGTATAYVAGVPVYQVDTIPGLVDTRWVPLLAPEVSVGGIVGLRATLRWLPSIDTGNYGKSKYLGMGIQWSPNFLLSPTFPVDVMVGYFTQEIDLGTIVQTDANSLFAAASKQFGLATCYGGLAWESSNMKVDYIETGTDTRVSYEQEGRMTSRVTLGATFNLGVKLNAEMGIGKMVIYNVGLMFGI